VNFSNGWIQRDGFEKGINGLVKLAFVLKRRAEIVVRFRRIGVEGECLAKDDNGFIELAFVSQRNAKIAMGF
jgi:hypothetical protein